MFGLFAIILGLAGIGWYAERNTKAKTLPPAPTRYAWVPSNGTIQPGHDYRVESIAALDEYGTPNLAVSGAGQAMQKIASDYAVYGTPGYGVISDGIKYPSNLPSDWPNDLDAPDGFFVMRTQFSANKNYQFPPVSNMNVWEWSPIT